MEDTLKATGNVVVELRDQYGNLKETRNITNLVVTAGRDYIASRMIGASPTAMSHMAVGTSPATPLAANTTLGAEIAASRTAFSALASVSGPTATYTTTFGAGVGTGAITEAGIFNAASAGTMLCRTIFGVINKDAADSLTINWNVTINAS